jgi:hypothetical protein
MERVAIEDFLTDVIDWATGDHSAKASRVMLLASDLLDRTGATETCLARSMGYTGPLSLDHGDTKALSVAEGVVTRASAALRIVPVDVSLVAAGLSAARRVVRAEGQGRQHDACIVALMGAAGGLAPRGISEQVP